MDLSLEKGSNRECLPDKLESRSLIKLERIARLSGTGFHVFHCHDGEDFGHAVGTDLHPQSHGTLTKEPHDEYTPERDLAVVDYLKLSSGCRVGMQANVRVLPRRVRSVAS